MNSRSEETYHKVLSILQDNSVRFPKYIIMDFELPQFNAFKRIADKTKIHFCLFHLGQSIWRKIQNLSFSQLYIQNTNFRLLVKCFLSLAFVPLEFLSEEYTKLIKKSLEFKDVDMNPFIKYFEKNYIKSKKYPLEAWNAFDRVKNGINLTSNSAESFNCHFNNRFEQPHSSLHTLIDKLKDSQSSTEQDIRYRMCNPELPTSEKDGKNNNNL